MKWIALSGLALVLAACSATEILPQREAAPTTGVPASPQSVTSLPAQRLQPGQCGLFLFEARDPNAFVLFEDEAAQTVQIVHFGQVYDIRVDAQGEPYLSGDPFSRVYRPLDGSLTFTLDGVVGQEISSGQRLNDVILTVREHDGTRTVRPLGGVRRCDNG